jgi:hypothetical protein
VEDRESQTKQYCSEGRRMSQPMRTVGITVRERCRLDLPCAGKDKKETNDCLLLFFASPCPRKDAKETFLVAQLICTGFFVHVQWAGIRRKIFLGAGERAEKSVNPGHISINLPVKYKLGRRGRRRGSSVLLGPRFGLASGSQEYDGPLFSVYRHCSILVKAKGRL